MVNIDSTHHEFEVINLNEADFDPVLRYELSKTDEERFVYLNLN